jgi:signal transduction histidine kinase
MAMGLQDAVTSLDFLNLGPNVAVHTMVELFCGVVALLIASLLLIAALHTRKLSSGLFGGSFLAMGMFDLLHAVTNPFTQVSVFVMFHTLSVATGAAFMLAGAVVQLYASYKERSVRAGRDVLISLTVIIAGMTIYFALNAPTHSQQEFDTFSHLMHALAGGVFAVIAVSVFHLYGERMTAFSLVIAAELLLFAVGVTMFRVSSLWDPVWWGWHFVKAVFYLVTLIIIIIRYVGAVKLADSSSRQLLLKNEELAEAHVRLSRLVDDLQIRNWMINKASSSFGLDATLAVVAETLRKYTDFPCLELVLYAPPDQVGESQNRFGRKRDDWCVSVAPRPEPAQDGGTAVRWLSVHHEAGQAWLRFALRAHDDPLGYVAVPIAEPEQLADKWQPLSDIAAEMGQIFSNTLMYEKWNQACLFRLGLLHVSLILRSTLDHRVVRTMICREGGRLLDSDGVAVLYRTKASAAFSLEECGSGYRAEGEYLLSWLQTEAGARLLEELGRERHGMMWRNGSDLEVATESRAVLDETLSARSAVRLILPLVEENDLTGIVIFFRNEPIEFSAETQQNGHLLIRQFELALENARIYEDLRAANLLLLKAEKRKLTAERLFALGEMAATVAHEIRNPLGAIVNCAAVLRGAALKQPKAKAALEIIEDESKRLERLATNFLNVGKSPRPIRIEPVRLESAIEKVCEVMRRHVVNRELAVTISATYRGDGRAVMFDSDGLHEVVLNLVLNAIQAIEMEGEVKVTVRQRASSIFIAVVDSGIGIPPVMREQVFEPFVTGRSEGAGVGLAIVRRLILSWNGAIRIWSAHPSGTCFAVRVPLRHDAVLPVEKRSPVLTLAS